MEHIRQHDWCAFQPDFNFLEESDMDSCVIEQIILNAFYDPMIPKVTEEQRSKEEKIDWKQVFHRNDEEKNRYRLVVPGLQVPPKFPKLSTITKQQHFQLLKVICAESPDVLALSNMARPNKMDLKIYDDLKEIYQKEQKEFIAWAKTLWVNNHCIRALRPKPIIETVYEAEFRKKAAQLATFPKKYGMAAHISLGRSNYKCDMAHKQDLINVRMKDLLKIQMPDMVTKKVNIMQACPVPEPCEKHPCWFVLPHERTTTILPLTEIHRELAQYSLDNGAKCIVSENALKCLLENDRYWLLPVTVCEAMNDDGGTENVLVIGSEFSNNRECAMVRTYRAYRHLLEHTLIPAAEKAKLGKLDSGDEVVTSHTGVPKAVVEISNGVENIDVSSDEEGNLVIAEDGSDIMTDDEDTLQMDTSDMVTAEEFITKHFLTPGEKRSRPPEKTAESPKSPTNDIPKRSPYNTRKSSTEDRLQSCTNDRRSSKDDKTNGVNDRRSSKDNKTNGMNDRRSSKDDKTNGVNDRRNSKHAKTNGANDRRSSKDGKTNGANDRRSSKDGKTNGMNDRRSSKDNKTTGVNDRRSSKDGKTNGVNDRRSSKDDKTNGVNVSGSQKKKKSDDFYNCTCKGFERPPPRSYRRWIVRNRTSHENISVIIHCAHKMKLQGQAEVIAEPIPEYQVDLGASKQSEHKIKSLALSLMLRKNASLLNVRIDSGTGEVVRVDNIKKEDFLFSHLNIEHEIANVVFDTVSQLQGLLPGCYILQHEPSHGANALLFASRTARSERNLQLDFNMDVLTEADESKSVKTPPELTSILLPIHKYRKMLPCAFPPYDDMVAKPSTKPSPKTKPPPQALRWPKRKRKKAKKT